MPGRSAPLAKLTRPKLFGAVPRERLFTLLDDAFTHPAVWIAGPPGAGKTSLVTGYLEARNRSALWYQVDGGDADIASFFYYLGQAGDRIGGQSAAAALPALTPEYLPDLPGFTRRFFRALYARLPPPSLLVLDNYQEVPEGAALHAVMAGALAEAPEGVTCVVVSRAEPPTQFARLRATQALASIDWNDLRLTAAEATAIASTRRVTDEALIKAAHLRSGGWVTGLILMLGQPHAASRATKASAASPEAVFSYFAGVLFNQLPPATREVLLATALLPRMTAAQAALVSGVDRAGDALRELHEQNYFVDRRVQSEPTYQLHALFREFLLDRLQRDLGPAERQGLAQRSADALASCGQTEEAIALHIMAGDWTPAIELILGGAPSLLAQGRWQTLQQQITALPVEHVEQVPWLQFWRGASEAAVDFVTARATLIGAFESFRRTQDALGQMLAAAAIIESYCGGFDDVVPAARWITLLDEVLAGNPAFPNTESELQVRSSLAFATLVGTPQDPRLPEYARRLMPLIELDVDANLRAPGVFALLNYHAMIGELEDARRASIVARALVANPTLLPMRKIMLTNALAYFAYVRAEYDEEGARFQEAIELAAQHGLSAFEPFLRLCDCWRRLERGECRTVAATLRHVESTLSPVRLIDRSLMHNVKGWLALLEGNLALAQQETEMALAMGTQLGWTMVEHVNRFALAEVLIERGEYAPAAACLARVEERFACMRSPLLDFHALLLKAYSAQREHDQARCAATLRAALEIGRTHGYVNTARWSATMMARLAAFALEHGIEAEYVRMLIRRRDLRPEVPLESWPWPIRIYTLGRFELLLHDAPVASEGKSQRKPLELLKVLIALGRKGVASDKLIGILWPEPPGDGGQKVLEITVHRLRKLLGNDAAVGVSDRHVTLDRSLVWVDMWALEHTLAALTPAASNAMIDLNGMEAAATSVLKLYRGHFLAGDTNEAWQIPVRNRLAGRFQRFVLRLGEHWEGRGQWARADELYQRAIELDPLAETFYRRQMFCLDAHGRRTEAIEVFRRCRAALSLTLGLPPSPETEALHRRLIGRE